MTEILPQFHHCDCEMCEWLNFGTFFKFPCIVRIYAWFFMHCRNHHSDNHTNHVIIALRKGMSFDSNFIMFVCMGLLVIHQHWWMKWLGSCGQCHTISRVFCQKGPTRHAYAWQIGPFWQDTLNMMLVYSSHSHHHPWVHYIATSRISSISRTLVKCELMCLKNHLNLMSHPLEWILFIRVDGLSNSDEHLNTSIHTLLVSLKWMIF